MVNRKNFPLLQRRFNNREVVYFDNSATAQKPLEVVEITNQFYTKHNSNVHRSINPLAEEAEELYENSRITTQKFLNAKYLEEIIFTKGATESINLVAKTYARKFLKKGDTILLSQAAHHANIVPWLDLKKENKIKIIYAPIKDFKLDEKALLEIIKNNNIKFLALEHASNVLGSINNLQKIIKLAKTKNIVTLIDAAQSAPHIKIDVQDLDCDFLAFSGHKVYGPTGIGVLYGKKELLEKMPSWQGGGDMIKEVYLDKYTPAEPPLKFEAGTPNIAGAIGMAAGLNYFQKNHKAIIQQEEKLTKYFLKKLNPKKYIKLIGPSSPENRLPVFSMVIDGVHPHDVADLLGEAGIMTRAGHHCAQPLHDFYKTSSTIRASLAFYNTIEEIDYFFQEIEKIYKKFQ